MIGPPRPGTHVGAGARPNGLARCPLSGAPAPERRIPRRRGLDDASSRESLKQGVAVEESVICVE